MLLTYTILFSILLLSILFRIFIKNKDSNSVVIGLTTTFILIFGLIHLIAFWENTDEMHTYINTKSTIDSLPKGSSENNGLCMEIIEKNNWVLDAQRSNKKLWLGLDIVIPDEIDTLTVIRIN